MSIMSFAAFPELKNLMGEDTAKAFQILVEGGINDQCETLKAALAVCFRNFMKNAKNTTQVNSLLSAVLNKLRNGGLYFEIWTQIWINEKRKIPIHDNYGWVCKPLLSRIKVNFYYSTWITQTANGRSYWENVPRFSWWYWLFHATFSQPYCFDAWRMLLLRPARAPRLFIRRSVFWIFVPSNFSNGVSSNDRWLDCWSRDGFQNVWSVLAVQTIQFGRHVLRNLSILMPYAVFSIIGWPTHLITSYLL